MGQIKNIKLHIVTDIKVPPLNFIPSMFVCGAWVKRGIAKEQPDKVSLEEADLQKLLDETKSKLKDLGGEELNIDDIEDAPEEEEEEKDGEEETSETVDNIDLGDEVGLTPSEVVDDDAIREEYGLDDYDEEEGSLMTGAGMAGLMYFD